MWFVWKLSLCHGKCRFLKMFNTKLNNTWFCILGCGVPVILFSLQIPDEDVRIIWVVFFSTQNKMFFT